MSTQYNKSPFVGENCKKTKHNLGTTLERIRANRKVRVTENKAIALFALASCAFFFVLVESGVWDYVLTR